MSAMVDILSGLEAIITAVIEGDDDNFGHLVEVTGLDPKTDFRHTDLSGVDFSNTDLRGFDFTGADLSGCTGVGVTYDRTTILAGANISGSLFQIEEENG